MTDCERVVVAIRTEHDRIYRCNAELRDELAEKDGQIRRLKAEIEQLRFHIAGQDRIIATWERAWGALI